MIKTVLMIDLVYVSIIFGLLIYYSFKYYKKREKKRSINFSKNELLTISNVIHQLLGHQISSDYDVSEYFKNYEKWEKKISINFSRNELLAISNAICQLWLHTSSNYFFDLEAEELVKKIDTYLYENDERSELI